MMSLRSILVFLIGVGLANPSWALHLEEKWDYAPMIKIPAGLFLRGSLPEAGRKDEFPQQKIFLDDFLIDKYEVTNHQYTEFLVATGHRVSIICRLFK